MSRARSAPSAVFEATLIVPSSAMSIEAPVSSCIFLMMRPPGPMMLPILSTGIFRISRRGAWRLTSARGLSIAVSIRARIRARASRASRNASMSVSSLMPQTFRSIWMPVMPWSVPPILRSMSP